MISTRITIRPRRERLSVEETERFARVALDAVENAWNRRAAPRVLDMFRREPGAVKYPFQFASERSRRAFFATNGFGRGIPTRRTGGLARGYRAITERSTYRLTMSIVNPVNYRKYVKGARQVPGHRRTGWGRDDSIAREAAQDVSRALFEAVSRRRNR